MSGKPSPKDLEIWSALQQAAQKGWACSIGIDRMVPAQIQALLRANGTTTARKPAILFASMSVETHDEETIEYAQNLGIQYNAFRVLKGCNFTHPLVLSIAATHNVTAAQVCSRWALQRVGSVVLSSGCDPSTAKKYTQENLGILGFQLGEEEVAALNGIGNSSTHPPLGTRGQQLASL